MLKRSRDAIIGIGCVILILILTMAIMIGKEDSSTGITAKSGLTVANKVAHNWSANYTLVGVRINGDMRNEGYFLGWIYTYSSSHAISNKTEYIEIWVEYNGNYHLYLNQEVDRAKPIINWTIDSDDAYRIIKQYSQVELYLSTYKKSVIDTFVLGNRDELSVNPVWCISWDDKSSASDNENYHRMYAEIDATTGAILYVGTNGFS
jgi:hypothetical protein